MELLPTIHRIPMLSTLGLDVLRLKLMAGWMTNTTYRVQVGPDKSTLLRHLPKMTPEVLERYKPNRWVLRIPGEVSSFSVSREHEASNALKVSTLGLNVPIKHFDPYVVQLTRFIENVQVLDSSMLQRVDVLQKLADLAKKLHQSEPFANNTAVFERNAGLVETLKTKKFAFPGEMSSIEAIEQQMADLQKLFSSYQIQMSPCHNDSTPLNYMMSLQGPEKKEVFYKIDWEYSSNNDLMLDLVYFAIEAKLTKEQEVIYLNAYFGKENVTESVLAWLTAYKPVVEWWITLWSWTQLANDAKSVDKDAYIRLGLERYGKTLMYLQSE
ncbi:MAG: phosphotransferase [Legionella sp.]